MRLKGKVALITGAASGIGRETALLFAKEGASVVVADVNDSDGKETVARIEAEGGQAVYTHADVSRAADSLNMVSVAEKTFGKLNVLFNIARNTPGVMLAPSNPSKLMLAGWFLSYFVAATVIFSITLSRSASE